MEDIIIVGIVMAIPITAILTAFFTRQSKIKLEALKYEIELENIRRENNMIETEKLRLEIEQSRQQLTNSTNVKHLE